MRAMVVYQTKTGHTEQAANDIARGLESAGVQAVVEDARGMRGRDVEGYDILVIGTPTYGNRRYRRAAAKVESFVGSIEEGELEGTTCGAFAVNAGVGAAKLVNNLEKRLKEMGGDVVQGGPAVTAGAPLSLWKGPDASEEDVEKCEEFGRRLASAAGN
jgi:flavodoxin